MVFVTEGYIDELGRIKLPDIICQLLDLHASDKVVVCCEEQRISVWAGLQSCVLCGAPMACNDERRICSRCVEDIAADYNATRKCCG